MIPFSEALFLLSPVEFEIEIEEFSLWRLYG